jgi:drug/metabolite transporter (DMT)-like permease
MAGCSLPPLGLYAALVEHGALYDPRLRGEGATRRWALVLLSGVVAFLLNLCNLVVTKRTSAVSLQVLGNVKVVLSIGVSIAIFGNPISAWSAAGCLITLGGVACYHRAPTS